MWFTDYAIEQQHRLIAEVKELFNDDDDDNDNDDDNDDDKPFIAIINGG